MNPELGKRAVGRNQGRSARGAKRRGSGIYRRGHGWQLSTGARLRGRSENGKELGTLTVARSDKTFLL